MFLEIDKKVFTSVKVLDDVKVSDILNNSEMEVKVCPVKRPNFQFVVLSRFLWPTPGYVPGERCQVIGWTEAENLEY